MNASIRISRVFQLLCLTVNVVAVLHANAVDRGAILTDDEKTSLMHFITDGDAVAKEIIWPTQRRTLSIGPEAYTDWPHHIRLHMEYRYALWVSELWFNNCQIKEDRNVRENKVRSVEWLRKIAVHTLIPNDINERLIALKDVPANSLEWGKQANVDLIVCQRFDQNPKWEVQETGQKINFLIVPELGIKEGQTLKDFAAEAAKTYLNLTPDERESLKVTATEQAGLVFGSMVVAPPYPEGLDEKDKGKWYGAHLRHWWRPVHFCSNGRYVFFKIFEFEDTWQLIGGSTDPNRF